MRLIVALWQDAGLATVTQNIIHRFYGWKEVIETMGWVMHFLKQPSGWPVQEIINSKELSSQPTSECTLVQLGKAYQRYNSKLEHTSNVPSRGAGTLFTGAQRPALVSANQRRRWWPREKPLHNGLGRLGVTPGQYASNAEGDDDGKTTATPKITFFANC